MHQVSLSYFVVFAPLKSICAEKVTASPNTFKYDQIVKQKTGFNVVISHQVQHYTEIMKVLIIDCYDTPEDIRNVARTPLN